MITLKESLLGNTREKVLNTKDKIGMFGSLFDIYNFGIYTSGINFVAAGYVDEVKLDSLTKGMSYINLDDTQSYKRLMGILNNPQKDYDRDNRPYFDVLLKILMWIENLPCLEFNTMREFEQGLPTWLSNVFKQITKKKIVVQMANFYDDIILSIEWKKGRGTDSLFTLKIDKQKAKEYFAAMNESLLADTKTKVKGVKDTLNILGKRCKIEDVRIYPYIYEHFRVFNTIELYDANVKKDIISDSIRKALDLFYRQLNSYSNHPDNDMYYTGVEQLFIWFDNLNINGVEDHKGLVEKINSEIDRQHISVDDKMWVKLRYVKGNKGYYGLYVSARNEVAQFVIEM